MIIKKLHAWLQSFYPLLLFTSTLFFFLPLYIYYTNSIEFSLTGKTIVIALTIITLVSSLIFSLAISLLPNQISKFISSLLTLISIAFWIQAYVLSWKYGVLDGTEINWGSRLYEGLTDGLIWLCILIIGIKYQATVYKHIKNVVIGLLIIQSISLISVYWKAPVEAEYKNYQIDESAKFQFSDKENVIVLVVDSFQSEAFTQIIQEHPEYTNTFSGFTYFANTTGGFHSTYPSIPLILVRKYYDNSIPLQDFIKQSYNEHSVFKLLKENGYRTEIYPLLRQSIYFSKDLIDNIQPAEYQLTETTHILSSLWRVGLFRSVPTIIKPTFSKSTLTSQQYIPDGLKLDTADSRKNIKFIKDMQETVSVSPSQPTFKFYHIPGAHAPFLINANLEQKQLPTNNYGYNEITVGTTKIIMEFLNLLKEKGVYDKSTIIISADHGSGIKIDQNKNYPMQVHVHPRATPLLLFKPAHEDSPLKTSEAPAALEDINTTINSLFRDDVVYSDKYSLGSIQENTQRQRTYFDYNWDHGGGFLNTNEYLPPLKKYIIVGPVNNPASWLIENQSYTIGTPVSFSWEEADSYKLEGWHYAEKGKTWTNGDRASLLFNDLPTSKDLELEANIGALHIPNKDTNYPVSIHLNNTPIGKWTIKRYGTYRVVLPQNLLQSKKNIITFQTPNGESPLDLGLNTDSRKLTISFESLTIKPIQFYEYNSVIDLKANYSSAKQFLANGWGQPEESGIWSIDDEANLVLHVSEERNTAEDLIIKANMSPFLHAPELLEQTVLISINGSALGEWRVKNTGEYEMNIPKGTIKTPQIDIKLTIPTARTPSSLDTSMDQRKLGIHLQSLSLTSTKEAPSDNNP